MWDNLLILKERDDGMSKRNVIIIGAAGRDFHNFNAYYRDNEAHNVVAFTAAQIPDIAGRRYPPELAGKLYPKGIPIYAEEDLPRLIKDLNVDECAFSYSDVSYQHVMSGSVFLTDDQGYGDNTFAPTWRSSGRGQAVPLSFHVRQAHYMLLNDGGQH